MNSKRSMWTVLLGAAGVGLLVTNCTLKTDSDDGKAGGSNAGSTSSAGNSASAGAGNTTSGSCTPVGKKFNGCICAGNVVSYQVCQDDGTYGGCVCASGTGGYGGDSSYAGAAGEGTAAASNGDAGAAGESGVVIDPTDCYGCLTQLCAAEWSACASDNETTVGTPGDAYCLGQGVNADPGQIELIVDCITTERAKGLVKRDAVRACGSTIGQSADPQFFVWAPPDMTPATENLVNCMADAPDETMPGDWATDPTNFPASGPRPWDAMTCAKLACTSAL